MSWAEVYQPSRDGRKILWICADKACSHPAHRRVLVKGEKPHPRPKKDMA